MNFSFFRKEKKRIKKFTRWESHHFLKKAGMNEMKLRDDKKKYHATESYNSLKSGF